MAADISKTCISIAAFSAAEDVSEHSVVKISTKNFEGPLFFIFCRFTKNSAISASLRLCVRLSTEDFRVKATVHRRPKSASAGTMKSK